MTPEERWIKIENALHALIETQGQHQVDIAENNKQIARVVERWDKMERKTSQIDSQIERIDAQIEKNTAAIRDLILVSRTLVDTQQAADRQMKQIDSDIRASLDRLVQTLEALFKRLQKPNGNQ